MKTATVIPLLKKGNDTDASNFRPISLTYPLARLFEIIVIKTLTRDFAHRLSPLQFGFLNKRSSSCTSRFHFRVPPYDFQT
uniref:Reverse transcriptase domain-containing protein n=1 Tax=Caenorhabditis japonica TaxID=281687 RepID=A0A8R1ELH3_CAEJA